MINRAIKLIILIQSMLIVSYAYGQSNPYQQVIGLFDDAQIVFLGERHWSKQDSDFRIALLKHRDLAYQIDDLVIEFGNSLYQNRLDAYFLDLQDISDGELSQVWRNTTQTSGVWDSPVYERFLLELRKVNERLPKKVRIRVVAAGPPIDWDKVEVFEDQLPFSNRGWSFVRIIEREVLGKDHKALVIIGRGHLNRRDDEMGEDDNLIRRLEGLYPKKRFSVVVPAYSLTSNATDISDLIKENDFPTYIDSHSAPFKNLEAANYLPGTIGLLEEVVDGLIFWGAAKDQEVGPDEHFYEMHPSYFKELERRRGLTMRLPLKSYN